jgi:hypothetical protein
MALDIAVHYLSPTAKWRITSWQPRVNILLLHEL